MAFTVERRLPDSANVLAGVALPAQVRWIDRDRWPGHTMARARAFSGDSDYSYQVLRAGRVITLDATFPNCWLYNEKYEALMAADQPGAVVLLVWGGENYSCRFNHVDGLALDFRPLSAVDNVPVWNTGIFEGQINLLTV